MLTCWCLKNVRKDIHARPICAKIFITLEKEPSAKRTAMLNRKFPAGICVPGITGWLVQENSLLQAMLVHLALMVIEVPVCWAFNWGFLALQKKQNWNNINSFDRNTMYFGSVLRSLLLDSGMLQFSQKIHIKNCFVNMMV